VKIGKKEKCREVKILFGLFDVFRIKEVLFKSRERRHLDCQRRAYVVEIDNYRKFLDCFRNLCRQYACAPKDKKPE
jgi:hypothetical protein